MIRAILLASATATTLKGRLARSAVSHDRARASLRAIRRTDVAPMTRRVRSSGLPIFEMRPDRSLPPLEWGLGANPSQAAKWRPDLNPPGSGTSDLMVAAVMAPTPGIVVRRRMSSSRFASVTIERSSLSIWSAKASI